MNKQTRNINGLLMVFTGDGKGKTTSAIGLAMRAAGHGMKVCFIQFIKGSWKYGEMNAFAHFADTIDFQVIGRGFTWKSDDLDKDREIAQSAWEIAKKAIYSNEYQLVVLDEFTYLLLYDMISRDEAMKVLREKPENLHLVITGRGALAEIIELADLVTEMTPVKHPFNHGIVAQKGVEF
jgi:cob(I)alamin adenosyltransferase